MNTRTHTHTHTHRHTHRGMGQSSRISSCVTMTRLVADGQQILTKQTDEETEMRQSRWADSETVRQVDTLMLIHPYTHLMGLQTSQTQAQMTSMTVI